MPADKYIYRDSKGNAAEASTLNGAVNAVRRAKGLDEIPADSIQRDEVNVERVYHGRD